ncbi:hypothetical protein AAMO2058_001013000 [Amorphochlora amoebiformis]
MQKALRELSVQCHVSVMSIWVETNPGREVNELVLRMDLLEDQKNLMKKLATEAALRYRNRLEGKYTSEVTPEINSRPHNRSEQGHQRIELRRLRKMCAKINEYISNNAINEMKVIYVKELDNRAKLETRLEDFFKHVGQSGRLFIEQKSEHRDRGRITWHFNRAQQDLVQRDRADPTHGRLEDSATSSTCNLNLSIGQSMNESGAVHGPDVCRGQSPADEKLINFSCCRCNQTFRSKSAHSRHRNTCLAIPGAVYDFLRLKITQTFKQPITEMKKEWTEYILEPLKKLSYPCTLDKYKKTLKISVFKRLEDCGIGRRNFIMMMCMEMPAHFNALADEEDYTNLNPCPTNHDDPFNSLNSNAHNSNLNDAKAVPIPNRGL